jgi:L-ascorbate metabolism protein UlaG (beta-lactamase superfamily)
MFVQKNVSWLGHDTFKITGEKVIYTDPYKIKNRDVADLILITHEHHDHCSPEDVEKLKGPETRIVTTADCAAKLTGDIILVEPGDVLKAAGVDIEVVPAYNVNKKFHPKKNYWVGYIFTVGGQRIYLAGDTDYIPEMKDFDADIALLPVGGTYTMNWEEAVKAALDIRPEVAVPMHYGSVVGSSADAEKFKKALEGKVEVVILPEK